ncbi:creatininase [Acetobacter nitrogenifigens DSM 23921 = NBRC 105050]|uniref:Creatininase n=1 Tax=Acetobacter nitrogenifigens DSM 23921 = NBRC 105050 TaxID=1120919 RepID=A0A511XC96_9PROT|nr:creatininase family protein [Acetobacter nitrogenifigens]GBQ94138.1 creatininase [Acetobacter nitrogenifigens DSM 23921 = NBRC 105050]GEN60560.1 creatininase [Acetobacter nitrogenifigens DSM 23921 = NBRC 105050]
MPSSYYLAELCAAEMREAAVRKPVILLPMGSFEDQGPHAPMGDYLSAAKIAEKIAERATRNGRETYVAPVVPFGGEDFFGYMPGGISLSQSTLRAVVDDMLRCLLRHDLTRVVFINGHGGNCGVINDATQKVWLEQRVIMPSFYLWRVAQDLLPGVIGEEQAARSSGHGCNPLTSVVMHLFPDLIRPEHLHAARTPSDVWGLPVTGFTSLAIGDGGTITVPLEGGDTVPGGVWGGDPRLCSAETGAQLVEKLVSIGSEIVQHVTDHSDPQTGKAIL